MRFVTILDPDTFIIYIAVITAIMLLLFFMPLIIEVITSLINRIKRKIKHRKEVITSLINRIKRKIKHRKKDS